MAKYKKLGEMTNKELSKLIKEIAGDSCTATVVVPLKEIGEQVNEQIVIPENQRDVKWDTKKVKRLEKEFIAYLFYTIIKMLATDNEELEKSVKKAFPNAMSYYKGYYQKAAISYNRAKDEYGMQDGQHRFFHYLINFVYNGLEINRDDVIDNAEVARVINSLFRHISNTTLKFDALPSEWKDAFYSIPVVVNYVDTTSETEAAALFIAENTSDPIKNYDLCKSGSIGKPGWERLTYVVESIMAGQEMILNVNPAGKEVAYSKKSMCIFKSMFPKSKEALTYFLQRNVVLFYCEDTDFEWDKGQTQQKILANYRDFTQNMSSEEIDKMLNNILRLYLSVSKYYNSEEDRCKIRGLQSFYTGLAYIEKSHETKYDDSESYIAAMKATVNDMVNDLTGDSKIFNNAHYQRAKLDLVESRVRSHYESIVKATRKKVA